MYTMYTNTIQGFIKYQSTFMKRQCTSIVHCDICINSAALIANSTDLNVILIVAFYTHFPALLALTLHHRSYYFYLTIPHKPLYLLFAYHQTCIQFTYIRV